MTQLELSEIAEEKMCDPSVSGCIVSSFRADHTGDSVVEQRHRDGRTLALTWHDRGDFRRCIVLGGEALAQPVAQVDLCENQTVRMQIYEPCRVTISQEEGFLCLSR